MSSPDLREQALQHLLALQAARASARRQAAAALNQFCAQSEQHRHVVEQLRTRLGPLLSDTTDASNARATRHSLRQHWATRVGGTLLVLLIGLSLTAVGYWGYGLRYAWVMADTATLKGEQRRVDLAGGTAELGSATSVDTKRMALIEGAVRLRPNGEPFTLVTSHGTLRVEGHPDGADLTVTSSEAWTVITVLAGSASLDGRMITAGTRAVIGPQHAWELKPIDSQQQDEAWRKGLIIVRNHPVADVLAQIERHFHGRLEVDTATVAALRVSAALPLNDPAAALALLQDTFPQLQVITRSPRWLKVKNISREGSTSPG
jgi:transmembrane sensor